MKINVSLPVEVTTDSVRYIGAKAERVWWGWSAYILGQRIDFAPSQFKTQAAAERAGKRYVREWARELRS